MILLKITLKLNTNWKNISKRILNHVLRNISLLLIFRKLILLEKDHQKCQEVLGDRRMNGLKNASSELSHIRTTRIKYLGHPCSFQKNTILPCLLGSVLFKCCFFISVETKTECDPPPTWPRFKECRNVTSELVINIRKSCIFHCNTVPGFS